jgi:hypothetical protein
MKNLKIYIPYSIVETPFVGIVTIIIRKLYRDRTSDYGYKVLNSIHLFTSWPFSDRPLSRYELRSKIRRSPLQSKS